MGTPLRLDTQEQTEYKSAILKLGELLMHRAVRPWLYVDAVFVFTPTYWIHKLVAKKLRTFSGKIIAQRKKTFLGSVSKKIDDAQFISKKRLAMLDLLLSAKEDGLGINDEGIQEEVDTFMFEVSSQARWYLALHSRGRKRNLVEWNSHLGSSASKLILGEGGIRDFYGGI